MWNKKGVTFTPQPNSGQACHFPGINDFVLVGIRENRAATLGLKKNLNPDNLNRYLNLGRSIPI